MTEKSRIIRAEDVVGKMTHNLLNGLDKGTTTYIPTFDEAWTWRPTEVTIYSGYANEGKGTWCRYTTVIKALEEGKKFVFYVPEDLPAEVFYDDLIHTVSGRSTDKDNPNFIGPDMYEEAYKLIKDCIYVQSIKLPHNTVETIVEHWRELKDKDPDLYGFMIDPIARMAKSIKAPERDDQYAIHVIGHLSEFAIETETVVGLVMHQQTPKRSDDGYYPEPNMYAVKGGGTYADLTDNVVSIWRPKYAREKLDTEVRITSQKIKRQKLVGIPQECKYRYNRKMNQYTEFMNEDIPLYDFTKFFNKKKQKHFT